jgi:hypothetical protein
MSEPTAAPAAAKAAAPAGGKSKMGPVGGVILLMVIVFSGVIVALTQQIAGIFVMIKMFTGTILLAFGAYGIMKTLNKK